MIRTVFAKHGLRTQVSKEGNLKFEIIELCQEDLLLEREHYYTNKNLILLGTNPHFPKCDSQKAQSFLKYHSFEKMGYLPVSTDSLNYRVYTRKRIAINMIDANVILIVGIKFI